MKKTFLLFITLFCLKTASAQYISYNGYDISESTLLVSFEDLNLDIKKKLICIGAEILWISPLSQTAKIYVDPLSFPIDTACNGDSLFFENIIDVNDGTIKLLDQSDDDNYDYKLGIDPPDPGLVGPKTPNLSSLVIPLSEHTVKVGIFDTGFNPNLNGGDTPNSSGGWDYINNSDQVEPDHYHGSHIASIAYGMINQDSESENIKYYNYKILNEDGSGLLSDIIISAEEAIVNDGVNILNFSLSGLNGGDLSSHLINMLEASSDENVLFVLSAGNAAVNVDFNTVIPAALQGLNVVTLASSRQNGKLSLFSNYGATTVDMLSPGENITGVDNYGDPLTLSGTSQSAAVATAVASMLGTYQDNFDGAEIKCALMNGVTQYEGLIGLVKSSGFINTVGALENLQSSNPCDGDFEYLKVKGYDISIFPNPVQDMLHITLMEGDYNIQVIDIIGRQLMSKSIIQEGEDLKIQVSGIENGIYQLRITNNTTKEVKLLKFVKQ